MNTNELERDMLEKLSMIKRKVERRKVDRDSIGLDKLAELMLKSGSFGGRILQVIESSGPNDIPSEVHMARKSRLKVVKTLYDHPEIFIIFEKMEE